MSSDPVTDALAVPALRTHRRVSWARGGERKDRLTSWARGGERKAGVRSRRAPTTIARSVGYERCDEIQCFATVTIVRNGKANMLRPTRASLYAVTEL